MDKKLVEELIMDKLKTYGKTLTIKEIIDLAGDSNNVLDIKTNIVWGDLGATQYMRIMYNNFLCVYNFNVENKKDGTLFVHYVTVM